MIAKNTRLVLSEEDQELCKRLANARYSNNRKNNITNKLYTNKSNEYVDLQGMGGEIALARMLGVEPDLTVHVRSTDTDSGDLVLDSGETIDVKTTDYPTGKLIAPIWKKPNVDYYALVTGVFPAYTYRGSLRAEELINPSKIGSLGYGDTYIATQSELKELI